MDDLISREKLLREIREILNDPNYYHEGEDWAVGLTIAEGRIERAELAYPKKGKWIIFDSQSDKVVDIKCSECKKGFAVDAYKWCDIGFTINDLHYCPNCGAMMESD